MFRFLACLLLLLATVPVCAQVETKEKLYHAYSEPLLVGDFKLQEPDGKWIGARDLLGKLTVVQFFYPGCNLCSRNTPTMKKLQDHFRGKSEIRLVSIDLTDSLKTIGPDTLDQFALDYEAELGQWLFLTGSQDHVLEVVNTSFYSIGFKKMKPMLGDTFAHKTDLVLLDWTGRMVGYVDGTKEGADEAIREQIGLLRARRRMTERIPITGEMMPKFNAMLNSACTILLLLGWILIRLGFQTLHKLTMLLALAVSMVFLSSYLFYHFVVMEMEPTRFRGEGTIRTVYFAILLSHTILAVVVAPLAIYITVQGLRNALAAHVKLARWTLPIWLYVSVTGVVVYWMLYRVEW